MASPHRRSGRQPARRVPLEGDDDEGARRLVATTIVSSSMLSKIAAAAGAAYAETLTGFKWIVRAARPEGPKRAGPDPAPADPAPATTTRFVLGYEEALGYCVGEVVRNKDVSVPPWPCSPWQPARPPPAGRSSTAGSTPSRRCTVSISPPSFSIRDHSPAALMARPALDAAVRARGQPGADGGTRPRRRSRAAAPVGRAHLPDGSSLARGSPERHRAVTGGGL